MKHLPIAAALTLTAPVAAQEAEEPVTPTSVLASASAEEWVEIAPEDLLVMELAPDMRGNEQTVVIQLISPPFSQPWVENVRTLAQEHWWDGTSVYRVQDNYVAQWGDASEQKPLPDGITAPNADYAIQNEVGEEGEILLWHPRAHQRDNHAHWTQFVSGWPIATRVSEDTRTLTQWPIHCYGYIGVARGYAPDTGTGAELYTLIGQPQRHMDRNLAVVGRVIDGMEYLSSLPRGSGELGFYKEEEADLRTPILSVRLASEVADPPAYEYLASDSESFDRYVNVRANRDDAFYTVPAGGVDVCSVEVPVRRVVD